jgi:uncharacterized protein YcbX
MPAVSEIHIYPIKSCRGVSVDAAVVGPRGLEGDRRYMLVDAKGRFLSQREHPRMAQISVAFGEHGYAVTAPGQVQLSLPRELPVTRECEVRVWRDTLVAALADAGVNRWFSDFLGMDCGLVYMADTQHRAVGNPAAAFDDEVSFADGAPVLMISQASLDDLNARLPEPVAMRRFRPNIAVTALAPYAEDGWARVAVGEAEFDVAWSCQRCVMTTIDPETAQKDPAGEPLATLRGYRRVGTGILFGQNLLPRKLGTVRVGDAVGITEKSS